MTPIPFSRTLRVLNQDRGVVPLLALGLGSLVLAVWVPWLLLARLPV